MLKNAYLLAKIGADTAENERFFAENLPKIGPGRGPAEVVVPQALRELRQPVPAEVAAAADNLRPV